MIFTGVGSGGAVLMRHIEVGPVLGRGYLVITSFALGPSGFEFMDTFFRGSKPEGWIGRRRLDGLHWTVHDDLGTAYKPSGGWGGGWWWDDDVPWKNDPASVGAVCVAMHGFAPAPPREIKTLRFVAQPLECLPPDEVVASFTVELARLQAIHEFVQSQAQTQD